MAILAIGQQGEKQSWAMIPFKISPLAEWSQHFPLVSCLFYGRDHSDGWLCSYIFVGAWKVQMTSPALAKQKSKCKQINKKSEKGTDGVD